MCGCRRFSYTEHVVREEANWHIVSFSEVQCVHHRPPFALHDRCYTGSRKFRRYEKFADILFGLLSDDRLGFPSDQFPHLSLQTIINNNYNNQYCFQECAVADVFSNTETEGAHLVS